MALSEKIELLGKGIYKDIPDTLTLTSIPTASELDYIGSEEFEQTMIEKIFPKCIEEKVDFNNLLEIDFQWILRCLRILNYGPYHTTNTIFCTNCGSTSRGEYQVDLRTIECKPLPKDFVNEIKISKDKFIDFDGDIVIKLPTIQDMLNARKDVAFQTPNGDTDNALSRLCYSIVSIKNSKGLTPIEAKMRIQQQLSAADYVILKDEFTNATNYGLRAGGSCICPKCHNPKAAYIALVDDRFFRATVGDLRKWKHDRNSGSSKDISGNSSNDVRKDN